ncbi:MAG: ribonuclease Z [Anaerolineae bacterium]|nr:ribonuclease Z [Anaerolineae bacterium]
MARLIVLGSAAAVSDEHHDNTHLLLEGENSVVLIDCGSNPVVKLKRFGIHYERLTDMILTHFHPDHVAGVPIFLMHMWLIGRKAPLRVYGLHHCLERTEDMMLAFSWDTWPKFFPVAFHRLPERPDVLVLDNQDFRITAFPVKHYIPTVGLRIEVKSSGKVIGYSCDTEPVPNCIAIGRDADLLVHEAAGQGWGIPARPRRAKSQPRPGLRSWCWCTIRFGMQTLRPLSQKPGRPLTARWNWRSTIRFMKFKRGEAAAAPLKGSVLPTGQAL